VSARAWPCTVEGAHQVWGQQEPSHCWLLGLLMLGSHLHRLGHGGASLLQHLPASGEAVLIRSWRQPCAAGSRGNSKHLTRAHCLAAATKIQGFRVLSSNSSKGGGLGAGGVSALQPRLSPSLKRVQPRGV